MKRENFSKVLTIIQEVAGPDVVLPFRMEFGKPFCRASFWNEIIAVSHRLGKRTAEALAAIPAYRSRGHGRNPGFVKSWFTPGNRESRSEYKPGANFEFVANARRIGLTGPAWGIA